MRSTILSLVLVLAGCCGAPSYERPPSTGDPGDTTYLIDADPDAVTIAELDSAVAAAETRLRAATVDGVVWPRGRSSETLAEPDQFWSGGDSLLFTGIALASWCWRYEVTRDAATLDDVLATAQGIHLLTHATGSPGVLCRCALPLSRVDEFQWPWPHREPFVGVRDGYGYYTRATRDQVTGLLVGLAWSWRLLEGRTDPRAVQARDLVTQTIIDVHQRFVADDWLIRNESGENDTSADDVDGVLRFSLEALVALVSGADVGPASQALVDHYSSTWEALVAWFNRFNDAEQYFGHNLRATRALTVAALAWKLAPDVAISARENAGAAWWRYVRGHRSAWFDAIWMSLGGEDRSPQILHSLKSLSLRPSRGWPSPYAGQYQPPGYAEALGRCTTPYVLDPQLRKPTSYTTWQKEPWDVGEPDPPGAGGVIEDIGLGMVSAYWLWRYAR